MNKNYLIFGGVVVVAIVLAAIAFLPHGGFGNATQSFWDTNGGYKVDGTAVIDGSGVVVAPISGTTIAGTTGTFTGAVLLKEPNVTSAADASVTTAQSGTTFFTTTAGVDWTLPTAATSAGVVYRFVLSGNFATTNVLVQGPAADATDDTIFGSLEVAGAVVLCSAEDTISFVNTAELPGDWIELRSDGTSWFITGQAGTSGGITCTDAD